MSRASLFLLVASLGPWAAASGCASAVVGGECATGYTNCHRMCIDTTNDARNCGGCDVVCPMTTPFCSANVCVATAHDAGMDAMPLDAGPRDAGPPDMSDVDMGYHRPPCNLGEIVCGGLCVPATHDVHHCGGCAVECPAGDVCAAGVCSPICMAPLTLCGAECIDTTSDALNCGTCGNACATGICIDSMCSAGRVGHVVMIGHDYANSIVVEDQVLGNAVLISVARPVRLLTFPGTARAMAVAGADHAVDTVATARTATIARTSATTVDEIPLRLASADVFLVYAQRDSIDLDLMAEGTAWSTALGDFVAHGGIVIVLDDDSGVNAGTWQIATAAGLLTNTSRTIISGTNVHVVAPGDSVAIGLPPLYRGQTATVHFDSTDAVMVVDDGMGHPVVIHRTVMP